MEGSEGKNEFVFCGACGTHLDPGVRYCTSCGASQSQFAEGGATEATSDAMPEGEKVGVDASANAPTEAMPVSSPPGGEGGNALGDWFFGRSGGDGGHADGGTAASASAEVTAAGQRGFFESLFDTRFESLITPRLVRFFYALSILVLGVWMIVVIVAAFAAGETTGVIFLFLSPLMALIYLIMIRLWLELIVVAFKIRDSVERVAENTERSE